MGPGDLTTALAALVPHTDARLLIGHQTLDDAGVFRLSADLALVQTVDFFAPIVDDPYDFGQVAAANALSDVYAMGGEPLTALSIVAFPTGKLPLEVLGEILRGGQDKVHEAGASLVGGHTITDDELKFGLSVTGRVHPDRILSNANARVGDRLILTKPIGTGLVATAVKRGSAQAGHEAAMVDSMKRLNRDAAMAALAVESRCATDITGFGLLGHAAHIARASQVSLRLQVAAVPALPGAWEALAAGVRTGGAERNDAYLAPDVAWGAVSAEQRALLVDPQTSGGLLVAVPADRVDDYLARVAGSVVIGDVVPRGEHLLVLAV
ncbi:MAG: selenide, water dikinase SelD [Gemmatimonadetes bacterium]|nr:selenide, water dikinase SelD [Gemmatimonadota bacterium]MCC6774853.1 selenide, water dikinase SelD [Gemmatimonadaceae bacterium]